MSMLENIRNIGIIAHIDAGKTTLTERMLFYTHKIHRMGEVHNGTATMDYLPEEQERGITISSACTSCQWNEETINIIDTPGHVDFTIEVERSLRVLDGAIGVFCAVGGVQSQTEAVWRQSERFKIPKIIFINKMDRIGASFEDVLISIEKRLNLKTLLITMPIGQGSEFSGIIDLICMKKINYTNDKQDTAYLLTDLSEEEKTLAHPWKEKLLETLAESDDIFFEQYLSENFHIADINSAIKRATLNRIIFPTLCGSALKNTGVQLVLDAACNYLPSPLNAQPPIAKDAQGNEHTLTIGKNEPFYALVFKILMEDGRKISFMRIYSGTISEGDICQNLSLNTEDRISRIYDMHADRREQMPSASAGQIIAVIGLNSAQTGSTYGAKRSNLLLEPILEYLPVITIALEPLNFDENKILEDALARFTAEDPTLTSTIDEALGHHIVSGMGELHLSVLVERIKREYKISPRVGSPKVIYRETILKSVSAHGEFDRELGNEQHYGYVELHISPKARTSGNHIHFNEAIVKNNKKQKLHSPNTLNSWLKTIKQSVQDSLQSGHLTGYPVQDVDVEILNIKSREKVSSTAGYHMAAGIAIRQALLDAKAIVLEPIMTVEISVHEDNLGAAIGLFTARKGKIEALSENIDHKVIQGLAPLRQLFGFSTALRSATQGRASLSMKFNKFDSI